MTCPPPAFPWSGSNRKSPQCQIHVSSHHLRISRGRGRRGMLPQSHSSTGNVSSFFPPAAAEEEETIFYRSIIQELSFFSFLLAMSSFSFLLSHPPTILSVSFSALPPLFLLLLPHFSPLRQKNSLKAAGAEMDSLAHVNGTNAAVVGKGEEEDRRTGIFQMTCLLLLLLP